MQAIFFAHGPFAEQIKSVAGSRKAEMGVEARGWVSTNPHVLESESAPAAWPLSLVRSAVCLCMVAAPSRWRCAVDPSELAEKRSG
jgi:hypothetical protein